MTTNRTPVVALLAAVVLLAGVGFAGAVGGQSSSPAEITVSVTDSTNGQANATVPITVEPTADPPGEIPAELDATAVTAVVANADVGGYSELSTINTLDAYASYLADGNVGGTQLESSLPILNLYAYQLETPEEFTG